MAHTACQSMISPACFQKHKSTGMKKRYTCVETPCLEVYEGSVALHNMDSRSNIFISHPFIPMSPRFPLDRKLSGTKSQCSFCGTQSQCNFGGTQSQCNFGGTQSQCSFGGTQSQCNCGGTQSQCNLGGIQSP